MDDTTPEVEWAMRNFSVTRSVAEAMQVKKENMRFWRLVLLIMVHIGEEYYFTQDGRIHPKVRLKAKRLDRTMV